MEFREPIKRTFVKTSRFRTTIHFSIKQSWQPRQPYFYCVSQRFCCSFEILWSFTKQGFLVIPLLGRWGGEGCIGRLRVGRGPASTNPCSPFSVWCQWGSSAGSGVHLFFFFAFIFGCVPSPGRTPFFRKILVSVKFLSAILGPGMGASILWTPGKMRSFCRKNNVHKIPRFRGGGGYFGFWGGGSSDFIIMGARIFLNSSHSEGGLRKLLPATRIIWALRAQSWKKSRKMNSWGLCRAFFKGGDLNPGERHSLVTRLSRRFWSSFNKEGDVALA